MSIKRLNTRKLKDIWWFRVPLYEPVTPSLTDKQLHTSWRCRLENEFFCD